MRSNPVTTGSPILASQYNDLRLDALDALTTASGAGELIAEHAALAASIHGLPSGVNVLGAKQAAGLRIEYAQGAATWTHVGGQWEVHSAGKVFTNPFSSILAIVDSHIVRSVSGAAYAGEDRGITYSLTAATKTLYIYNTQGEYTSMEANFLIIGV